ncbi:unnamed protein product [Soboliphyme baturini]|uniref:BORCS6 domain-containing protein n=1 Tax=Soboliphyme baturini TaxID=241478 RepID=A0A183IBU1_9BILA|nr:unnamed protein product [Soboliphyme baturini]
MDDSEKTVPQLRVQIDDLEADARRISTQLDRILVEFKGSIHGMSQLTVECSKIYQSAVLKVCDSSDAAVKSLYQLMARADSLLDAMKQLPDLAQKIKDIKQMLDILDSVMRKQPDPL